MLATSSYTVDPPHNFLPTIPSPLSPRSVNIHGRRSGFMSHPKDSQSSSHIPFSKRLPVKKAPSPKQDVLKERRRNIFLRKVKDGREEKRYEARGEDIMRLDFVQRQKQWEAEQARSAPQIPSDPPEEDEEYDLPSSSGMMQLSSQPNAPDDQADEVAQREQEELDALVSLMEDDADGANKLPQNDDLQSQHIWSDDDDYDALFSQFVEQDPDAAQHAEQAHDPPSSGDAMDMS